MAVYADSLVALAEGRTDPADWLAWWTANEAAVGAACPRGWLLRLRPRAGGEPGDPLWTAGAVAASQAGACYVLGRLGVPVEPSDRYTAAYDAEFERWSRAERAESRRRTGELTPIIDALAADFPKLARFLRRNTDEIESMLPGMSPATLTSTIGMPLPAAYLLFLSHTRELVVGDTLRLTRGHPFVHTSAAVELPTEGMLCFGEYWLEADGDQVLFDLRAGMADDPPVLYYAYARRVVEPIGRFTEWVESLPGSLSRGLG
ncbi:hypothetical protein CLV71_10141 [Actinophytocola oryzae]|uniref:Uncharacterized protein n=2 Tax=Actinophytocola oryzae TaxID=502181 RepID=A0A4R7W3E1_9PSEU|nr:hypothetical protein CLV71_10141 [Actinophytocola oryzae]